MMGNLWGPGTGWGIGGGILMLLFWVGFIALTVWVIKLIIGPRPATPTDRSSLDIARERLARGEISREQFEQIKQNLL